VPEGDHPTAQKESAVIERDEDFLVRLLRRLPQSKPGRQIRSGCPGEEALAVYLSGAASEADNAILENHLTDCAACLDELRAAHHAAQDEGRAETPAKAAARAMALLAKPTLTSEIFNLVVGLARDSLELISTSGRLVMPALAADVRGKGKAAGAGIVRIEKTLGELQIAVEVERLEGELCQVAVNVTPHGKPAADTLRLSLFSGAREQASFLARQGSAIFDRIAPGEYQLAVSAAGNALGTIGLTIQEGGHE
jgi:hypothetical protein